MTSNHTLPNWRKLVSPRMAAAVVIPILRNAKDVVQVALAEHARRVEDLVLEGLDDSFDEGLQVRDDHAVKLSVSRLHFNIFPI
ncbi:MAG: hypothetical protein R3C53_04900 [Pirellulaceae bacterium]